MKPMSAFVLGVVLMAAGAIYVTRDAHASTTAIATIVGVEKHSNPYGDRWIEIQPQGVPHVGLWVSEACALTLSPGDDWPSANAACH